MESARVQSRVRLCAPAIVPILAALWAASATLANEQTAEDDAAKIEFFEKNVRPLLVNNCHTCHSAETNSQGGLRVDDRNGLLAGGGRGPAIVPGKPDESRLIKAVRYAGKLKMPPTKQLSDDEVAVLVQWVADGAAWPRPRASDTIGETDPEYERLRKEHWAWQPLSAAAVPQVRNAAWARDDIDRFILARLEEQGLEPVGDADKQTLIRRVTFDLTGLPPAPAEIEAFAGDGSPDAFESLVDRLLSSPAFGERWGRHWLDVARYGESTGSARNLPYPHAWRYRDYVINAFNNDKPYDRFVREQIAGDLLPANSPAEKVEQLIATGFLALGVKDVNQRFKVRYIMDNVDEQIDTVSRALLALTASCARCHDHKFDPIPTTDYYALAGIFRSTELCAGLRNKMGGGGLDYYDPSMLLHVGLEGPPVVASRQQIEEVEKSLADARAEFQALRDSPEGDVKAADGRPKRAHARQRVRRLEAELQTLRDPASNRSIALGVRDAKVVGDTEIRIRGEAEKLGPAVPRGFLRVVELPDQPVINPEQSGRLELARWLTSGKNPLTSRVMANRVWQHLFGRGLVKTVDNFGVMGDTPSHPELLDHLAARFVHGGWSIKKIVRALVLTRAYQLSSEAPPAYMAVDPANRLLWRHSPRRLDAEEIRDAMLAAAGRLNLSPLGGSPARDLAVIELPNNGPDALRLQEYAQASQERSVYLPLLRGLTPISLFVFDFAEQGMVTGSRDSTTVAPQALYMLNDPFVLRQSLALAERLERTATDDAGRIQLSYLLTMGRSAASPEVERALNYVYSYDAATRDVAAVGSAPPGGLAAVTANNEAAASDANAGGTPNAQGQGENTPTSPGDPPNAWRQNAWASYCQALFGAAEFRYLK